MDNKYHDYNFLFEERNQKRINGGEIAVLILGSLSVISSFSSFLISVALGGIGLIVSKMTLTDNSKGMGKIGFWFCKIGICLGPALLIINFLLSLFVGISIMSIFTRMLTL